ncbi:hypothetical protein GE253_11895 [Niveispirillum sp. SYP-B3756]|uniref:hypothetical protein n=1 Tax=Niveispirillum sp. SYP-B3756 TaxID=2662178 RepID=UPI001292055E|nr:hypothetical protein [Niveispirillum sp. SYP-B3756]MQP66042.1 hypothetical protein [Niveispirillum sp. SYP-B3756]
MDGQTATVESGSFVGLFLLELPDDWWVPDGYGLIPNGTVPLHVTAPDGLETSLYADPSYQPPAERLRSIAEVIAQEIGPLSSVSGFGGETRRSFGLDRPDLLGTVNRVATAPINAAAYLFDLAAYGIQASIIGGTEMAARQGWIERASLGRSQRETLGMVEFLAAETGVRGGRLSPRAEAAVTRLASTARFARDTLSPLVMRLERGTGLARPRTFQVVELVEAREVGTAAGLSQKEVFRHNVREGIKWEKIQSARYQFTQIYVVRRTGKGYYILDAIDTGPSGGPVSMKFSQLADIKIESALAKISEAKLKYAPGTEIANVKSRPRLLQQTKLTGQLWLEVPKQNKKIPEKILKAARKASIKIRDTEGNVYE